MLVPATEAPQERRRHSQQRKQTRTQSWMDQPKKSEESSVDATSVEQERRSKQRASCSGQSEAKEKGKGQKTREGQHNVSGRPHIKQEEISARQHNITESCDDLATQELQGSRSREHQPLEVATLFVG